MAEPVARAAATISRGVVGRPGTGPVCSRGHWEICQFWQKRQWRLQPTVAIE